MLQRAGDFSRLLDCLINPLDLGIPPGILQHRGREEKKRGDLKLIFGVRQRFNCRLAVEVFCVSHDVELCKENEGKLVYG